jgi:hypothetical protein
MGDLVPFTDEQAKLLQELLKSGRDAWSYVANILGDITKDLVDNMFGDRLKIRRAEQLAKLWAELKLMGPLHKQGIYDFGPPNPKLAIPILATGGRKSGGDANFMACLLAASMNPTKETQLRLAFIEKLKKVDPPDTKIIMYFAGDQRTISESEKEKISTDLGLTLDWFLVSVRNLRELFIAYDNGSYVGLTPFGH